MVSPLTLDVLGALDYGDPDGEALELRIMGMIPGVVLNREDPEGRGRVRVRVNALFEEGTNWLIPLTVAGGAANRGKFDPPRRGAVVMVWFPLGSIESSVGFYLAGGWNKKSEVPSGALVEGDRTRAVEEDAAWILVRDDRENNSEYSATSKVNGAFFSIRNDGTITLEPGTSNAGLLSDGATEPIVRGTQLSNYFNTPLTGLVAWLEGLRAVVVGLGGVYPTSPPSLPVGVLSDEWRVK